VLRIVCCAALSLLLPSHLLLRRNHKLYRILPAPPGPDSIPRKVFARGEVSRQRMEICYPSLCTTPTPEMFKKVRRVSERLSA